MPRWLLALGALAVGAVAVLYARRGSPPELAAAPAPEPDAPAARPASPTATPASSPSPVIQQLDPQPKDRVLQLGLATDELTFELAEALAGGKLEVFDSDEEAVDALADRARSRGLKNVSGWHGDPHALLFEDDRFDRALLLRDDEEAKREVERVLKPNGRYVATSAAADA